MTLATRVDTRTQEPDERAAQDPDLRRRGPGADRRRVRRHPRPRREGRRSSTTRGSRSSPTSRTRWPAPTWRSSSFDPSTATADAVPGDVQGQEVGHPVALQLPGRRARTGSSKTAAGGHGPDQGHDPPDQRRGPGGDGRDRPARRQDHDARRAGASGSRSATPPRRSWPTSSSATRSRAPSARTGGGQRYVRVPDQKRTYGVNIKAEPLDPVRRLDRDQPAQGRQPARSARSSSTTTRSRKIRTRTASRSWSLRARRRSVTIDRARTRSRPVDDGSRPIPAGPGAQRGQAPHADRRARRPEDRGRPAQAAGPDRPRRPEDLKLTRADRRSRSRTRASILTRDRGSSPTRATCIVSTDEGVVYTLRYGGPSSPTGDELTAGTPDDAEKKKDERQGQEGRRQEVARAPRRTGT